MQPSSDLSPRGRLGVIALIGFAVVAGGTLVGRISGAPKTVPSPRPASVPRELRVPVGALTYRLSSTARALATISLSGEVRFCAKGSESLRIVDVHGDTVLYADRDLATISLECKMAPRTIVALSELLGRPAEEGDEFSCARWSPDGTRLAVGLQRAQPQETNKTLVAGWPPANGSIAAGWTEVDSEMGCQWVDDRHLLRDGIKPWAIDVESRRGLHLSDPSAWYGSISSNGRRAILVDFPDDEPSYLVVDLVTGRERRIRLDVGIYGGEPVSVWAPRSPRIVTTDGDRVYVYDETGALRFSEVILPATVAEKDANVSWLDDRRIWVGGSLQSGVIDTKDGFWRGVTLPGWEPDPENGSPDSEADLQVFTPTNREGTPSGRRLFTPIDEQTQTIEAIGISFRRPRAWRIVRCVCSRTVHRTPAYTFGGAPPVEGPAEVPGWMAFSETSETVGHYVRRLSAKYEVGRKHEDEEERDVSLRRSQVVLDGVSFESLEFGFWEGRQHIYVGRVRERTIVIEIEPLFETDPWLRLVLDSLRFEDR